MITDKQRDSAHSILYRIDTLLNQFLTLDMIKKTSMTTNSSSPDSGDTSGVQSGSNDSTMIVINTIKSGIKVKLTEELENLRYEIRNNI